MEIAAALKVSSNPDILSERRMRELRGQGVVQVLKVHTDDNPADLFTKMLKGSAFIKHRRTCMNLPGDIGQDRMTGSSHRESGNDPARSVLAQA